MANNMYRPPHLPSGLPYPPSGLPYPPSGLLPPPLTGNDCLLPGPPPYSPQWRLPLPRGIDTGQLRIQNRPRALGRGWSRGYHTRGRGQQKRYRNFYEYDSAEKRTRKYEEERPNQSQYLAFYSQSMFEDPWRDLINSEEEQAHILQIARRFGQQSTAEECPEDKCRVLGKGDEPSVSTSQACLTTCEKASTSLMRTAPNYTSCDSSKGRTRPSISLPPPRFTSKDCEQP